MTIRRSHRLCGVAAAATLLLAACGGDEDDSPQDPEQAIPVPEHEADDSVRLPIGLVSPEGHSVNAPISEDGQVEIQEEAGSVQQTEVARTAPFGCDDTVSVIATVPMVTDDPAQAAVEFLLQDQHYHHGEPAFRNPLAISDDLEVETVAVDGDVVTVELSGQPAVRSTCESWQIYTQLDATARAATGVDRSEILLDGEPLTISLGIDVGEVPVTLQRVTEVLR
ncbi:GerMN domain-containing protein [Nesterenkonia sp. HG001]|uniref:GerMN domain-containing protein n=1 Tax=Nesterenkonia sp. HG001 TaxID=2983207 RepID=UPI002AC629F6|nr:GerMN domain-containing protein [Nesterenkonia sp. HG001]MDZ5077622.1 GerMN domain-containing protein [Nesterenkonia sp. HG001]